MRTLRQVAMVYSKYYGDYGRHSKAVSTQSIMLCAYSTARASLNVTFLAVMSENRRIEARLLNKDTQLRCMKNISIKKKGNLCRMSNLAKRFVVSQLPNGFVTNSCPKIDFSVFSPVGYVCICM